MPDQDPFANVPVVAGPTNTSDPFASVPLAGSVNPHVRRSNAPRREITGTLQVPTVNPMAGGPGVVTPTGPIEQARIALRHAVQTHGGGSKQATAARQALTRIQAQARGIKPAPQGEPTIAQMIAAQPRNQSADIPIPQTLAAQPKKGIIQGEIDNINRQYQSLIDTAQELKKAPAYRPVKKLGEVTQKVWKPVDDVAKKVVQGSIPGTHLPGPIGEVARAVSEFAGGMIGPGQVVSGAEVLQDPAAAIESNVEGLKFDKSKGVKGNTSVALNWAAKALSVWGGVKGLQSPKGVIPPPILENAPQALKVLSEVPETPEISSAKKVLTEVVKQKPKAQKLDPSKVSREDYLANRPKPYLGYEADTVETLSRNLPDEGKPGYSKEPYYVSKNAKVKNTPADFKDAANYVYRDEDGSPVGVLTYLKGEGDQKPSFTVAVDPKHQRKGIATKLYDMAEADGLDVDAIAGAGGLTEEGAKFHYSRVEKKSHTKEAQPVSYKLGKRINAEAVNETDLAVAYRVRFHNPKAKKGKTEAFVDIWIPKSKIENGVVNDLDFMHEKVQEAIAKNKKNHLSNFNDWRLDPNNFTHADDARTPQQRLTDQLDDIAKDEAQKEVLGWQTQQRQYRASAAQRRADADKVLKTGKTNFGDPSVTPEQRAATLRRLADQDEAKATDLQGKINDAQKTITPINEARDFTGEHATQQVKAPSTYQDAAKTVNRTVPELAEETRRTAADLAQGTAEPGGVSKGPIPGPAGKRPPTSEVPPAPPTPRERPKQELTGLARRFEDAERSGRGLEPTKRAARSLQAIAEEGRKLVDNGDVDPEGVIADSVKTGRGLTPEEVAGVGYHKIRLANQYDKLKTKLQGNLTPAERATALENLDRIESQLENISYAAQNTRTTWHEGGVALQIARTRDYSTASILGEAKAFNNGEAVPNHFRKTFEDSATKIRHLETAMKGLEAALDAAYKKLASKGTRSKDVNVRIDSLAQRVRQQLGQQQGTPTGAGMKSKQTGAIRLPQSALDKLMKDTRALARSYIEAGAKDLDEVLVKLRKDVPGIADQDWLGLLDGSYRKAALEANIEKLRINRSMRTLRAAAEFRNLTPLKKAGVVGVQTIQGLSRNLKVGFDLSILMIQGRKALKTNPGEWVKAWAPQIETILRGEEGALKYQARRQADPEYAKAVQAGVDFLSPDGPMSFREENYASRLPELFRGSKHKPVRVVGEALYRSEASATEAMNELRFGLFKKFAAADPTNPEYLKGVAQMVNSMTGRPIGRLRKTALDPVAGGVVFSPGWTVSKWQYALGQPIWGSGNLKASKHAAISYAKDIGVTAGAIVGAKMFLEQAGYGTVQTDPRHADFGRMQVGDYTVDLFRQDGEVARVVTQMLAGRINQEGKYSKPSGYAAGSTAFNYAKNKLAPLPALGWSVPFGVFDSKTDEGRPLEARDVGSMFAPMSASKPFTEGKQGFNPYLFFNVINDVEERKLKDSAHPYEWAWTPKKKK